MARKRLALFIILGIIFVLGCGAVYVFELTGHNRQMRERFLLIMTKTESLTHNLAAESRAIENYLIAPDDQGRNEVVKRMRQVRGGLADMTIFVSTFYESTTNIAEIKSALWALSETHDEYRLKFLIQHDLYQELLSSLKSLETQLDQANALINRHIEEGMKVYVAIPLEMSSIEDRKKRLRYMDSLFNLKTAGNKTIIAAIRSVTDRDLSHLKTAKKINAQTFPHLRETADDYGPAEMDLLNRLYQFNLNTDRILSFMLKDCGAYLDLADESALLRREVKTAAFQTGSDLLKSARASQDKWREGIVRKCQILGLAGGVIIIFLWLAMCGLFWRSRSKSSAGQTGGQRSGRGGSGLNQPFLAARPVPAGAEKSKTSKGASGVWLNSLIF